jgi:hypothetical protein
MVLRGGGGRGKGAQIAPILPLLDVPAMGRAISARRRPESDRTKKSRGPTSHRSGSCLWACKVLADFRTKMFHVKHFWNNSKLEYFATMWDSSQTFLYASQARSSYWGYPSRPRASLTRRE